MSEKPSGGDELGNEFRRLGENLRNLVDKAWNNEERVRLTEEIEASFSELGSALDDAVQKVVDHPETQRLKEEVDEFGERVRSGEFADQIKQEVLDVINQINERFENTNFNRSDEEKAD